MGGRRPAFFSSFWHVGLQRDTAYQPSEEATVKPITACCVECRNLLLKLCASSACSAQRALFWANGCWHRACLVQTLVWHLRIEPDKPAWPHRYHHHSCEHRPLNVR